MNQTNTFENQDYISFQRALYQDILSNQMNKKEIIEIDDDSDDEVEICDVNMQNKNLPSNRSSILLFILLFYSCIRKNTSHY